MGYKVLKSKGKVVLVGVPKKGENINIFSLPIHFGKTILGSHGGGISPEEDILRYLKLINHKSINLERLISDYYYLKDINNGISKLLKGDISGRIMIKF